MLQEENSTLSRREMMQGSLDGMSKVSIAALLAHFGFSNQMGRALAEESQESSEKWNALSSSNLLTQSRWAVIDLSLGNIRTMNVGSATTRQCSRGEKGTDYYEMLSISGNTVVPSVQYAAEDGHLSLFITVDDGTQVRMEQTSKGADAQDVVFTQSASGQCELQVGKDKTGGTLKEANIWRMLLKDPEATSKHLAPLLSVVTGNDHIVDQAKQLEDGLFAKAGSPHLDPKKNRLAIHNFNSDSAATRRSAHRQLMNMSIRALPHLQAVDLLQFDRGERHDLERVITSIEKRFTDSWDLASRRDSNDRNIIWLYEDPKTWEILSTRDDPTKKAVALQELSIIAPHRAKALMNKYEREESEK